MGLFGIIKFKSKPIFSIFRIAVMQMDLYQWIHKTVGIAPALQQKLVLSLLLYLLFRLVLVVVLKLLQGVKDSIARYQLNKIATGLIVFTGIMVIGRVWFQWFEPLAIFIAIILGAGLISLKDIFFDLAGWAYIVWRRPFETNDWIAVGDETGEVLEIGRVQLTLLETSSWDEGRLRSGRIIHVPNGKVFREKVINYSKGYRYVWNELTVQLTFDSNWQKAKEILMRIVNRYTEQINKNTDEKVQAIVAKKCKAFYNKLTPEIYTEGVDGRIVLTTRFLCEPDKRRITTHAIWEDVLREFKQENDIRFAFSVVLDAPEVYPAATASEEAASETDTDKDTHSER